MSLEMGSILLGPKEFQGFSIRTMWPNSKYFMRTLKIIMILYQRWWFLYFWNFHPFFGEDEPNLTVAYFSDGWFNHQPVSPHIPHGCHFCGLRFWRHEIFSGRCLGGGSPSGPSVIAREHWNFNPVSCSTRRTRQNQMNIASGMRRGGKFVFFLDKPLHL